MLNDLKLVSVYSFTSNRTQWKRNSVSHMVLAYQLDGHYDHEYQGQILSIQKDSLLFVHCEDSYAVRTKAFGRCIAIHFTVSTPIDMHFSVFDCTDQPQVKKEFLKILSAWNRHNEIAEYECLSSFYKLWAQLLHFEQKYRSPAVPCGTALSVARNYLAENFQDPLVSIAQAAQFAGISERWLCSQFQEVYQMSPIKYLTSLRITAALEILKTQNYTVSEIAASVGFSSANYFIRVFRSEIGMTPHAYQKANC